MSTIAAVGSSSRRKKENSAPTPASSPWLPADGKSTSIACRISWSLPLHGRLEPAATIAIPDSTSASASAVRNRGDSTPSTRCRIASAAVLANVPATPSTGSPRTSWARFQSSSAERLLTTSPIPERTIRGGEART